ncbi:hypothetical protein CIW54_23590 [Paraburkholderia sp. T12-10]|nr:hypothetical protein CIW54_23590 [Paraburkholderia sp. T12-10]
MMLATNSAPMPSISVTPRSRARERRAPRREGDPVAACWRFIASAPRDSSEFVGHAHLFERRLHVAHAGAVQGCDVTRGTPASRVQTRGRHRTGRFQ